MLRFLKGSKQHKMCCTVLSHHELLEHHYRTFAQILQDDETVSEDFW